MQPNDSFAPAENTSTETVSDYMEALVGPGKKYESVEDLAKGAFHAQTHIKTLQEEAAETKSKLEAAKTIEEVLAAVDQRQAPTPTPASPLSEGLTLEQGAQPVTPSASEPLNPNTIEETVKSLLARQDEERQAEQNFRTAVSALDAKLGSRRATNEAVEAKAQELGVGVDWLQDMARKNSKAFLTLMGDSKTPELSPSSPRDVSTQGFIKNSASLGEAKPGTHRYYQELRRSNPREYKRLYSTIMKQASENPDKFYERSS